MLVIAKARGYCNGQLYNKGDQFEVADGRKGSWFTPMQETVEEKPKAKKPQPKKEEA